MGSPERPIDDVEMGELSDETKQLNPDVKIEADKKEEDSTEQRFTGLKKDELLAIANEPKWVRARWALFIIFWLVWIAMLVGAILIVVKAPRCKPEPKPEWYQDVIVYAVNVEEFANNFMGMKEHLPYVSSLSSAALLISGAGKTADPSMVVNDNETEFKMLVTEAKTKGVKTLLDISLDTLSTQHQHFIESASAACAGSTRNVSYCDLFIWNADPTAPSAPGNYAQWVSNSVRGERFLASKEDSTRAFLNYNSSDAMTYVNDLLKKWFERDIAGIQVRDIARIQNKNGAQLVKDIWNMHISNKNNETARALFVYSSMPSTDLNPVMVDGNSTNTVPSPVILNDKFVSFVAQDQAGKMIKDEIEKWRVQSRSIGGYLASSLGGKLAAARYPNSPFSAGLTLLSLSLPGVPVLRSGDEVGATTGKFNWTKGDAPDNKPANADENLLAAVKELAVRRVEGIQAMQSLRYDTRDEVTKFDFIDIKDDVLAFHRKWDTKAAVLVVSNMSPKNSTVSVVSNLGLKDSDGKPLETAKVIASSSAALKAGDSVDLSGLEIKSGTTLILEA